MRSNHPWPAPGSSGAEQFEFGALFRELDQAFELESNFPEYRDRTPVLGRRDGDDAPQSQYLPGVTQNRRCGFGGISLRAVPRQKCESYLHVRETVALDQ